MDLTGTAASYPKFIFRMSQKTAQRPNPRTMLLSTPAIMVCFGVLAMSIQMRTMQMTPAVAYKNTQGVQKDRERRTGPV